MVSLVFQLATMLAAGEWYLVTFMRQTIMPRSMNAITMRRFSIS